MGHLLAPGHICALCIQGCKTVIYWLVLSLCWSIHNCVHCWTHPLILKRPQNAEISLPVLNDADLSLNMYLRGINCHRNYEKDIPKFVVSSVFWDILVPSGKIRFMPWLLMPWVLHCLVINCHGVDYEELTHLSWTKWPPFCRQHIQMHLHEWNFCVLIKISLKLVPKGLIDNNYTIKISRNDEWNKWYSYI